MFNEYQQAAIRTANTSLTNQQQLMNAALGMCGEAGEFADLIKKHLFQGKELDKEHLVKELGDVLWYVALAATVLNVNLSWVAQTNISKLRMRYPEGFSEEQSNNRKEGDI